MNYITLEEKIIARLEKVAKDGFSEEDLAIIHHDLCFYKTRLKKLIIENINLKSQIKKMKEKIWKLRDMLNDGWIF